MTVAGFLAPSVGWADSTYVWINQTDASAKFTDGANWQGGAAPDVSNIGTGDPGSSGVALKSVDFGSAESLADGAKPQTILLPAMGANSLIAFGKVTASPYQLLLSDYTKNGYNGAASDQIWLKDAADFRGLIVANPAGGSGAHNKGDTVCFLHNCHLPLADGRHFMGYGTRAYNSRASVGQLAGAGCVLIGTHNYICQGTTTFQYPSGPETSFYVQNGVLALEGFTRGAALVNGAILHFDASDASTLTVSDGTVTQWRDKSGRNLVATTHSSVSLASPCENPGSYTPAAARLSSDSESGLSVVSFGAPFSNRGGYRSFDDHYGTLGEPAGLQLSSPVTGVKEVFFVFRDTIPKGYLFRAASPFVLGTESGHAAANPFGRLISDANFVDGIFGASGPAAMLTTSAVFVDGQRIIPADTKMHEDYSRRLHVVSCGLSDGTGTIEALGFGSDKTGNIFYGGVQVAEIIAYDRALTPEERHQVQTYLAAKWQPKQDNSWDYGSLWLTPTSTGSYSGKSSFDAGQVAVRDFRPLEKTFVKDGAGTLVIGRLHGFDDYEIIAKNGDVKIVQPPAPREERAADPLMWFDATQVSSDKILHSNNVDYVTEIVDPRPEGKNHLGMVVKAIRHDRITSQTGVLGAYATLQPNALNGKPIFNFGAYSAVNANANWGWEKTGLSAAPYRMTLNTGSYSDVMREGFAVVRIRPDSATRIVDVFGGGSYEVFGGNLNYLVSDSFSSLYSKSALWRVNGEIVNPLSCARTADKFYLVSVAFPRPVTCNTIGIDRNAYSCGGIDIAEMIVYDRTLTDAERVNTEAYLMRKWFDQAHPYAAPVKVKVTSPSAPEKIVQGSGALELSGIGVSRLQEIEVRGGLLKWVFDGDALFNSARVHLDATVASSLVTTGGTWVTEWCDARGNAVKAQADMGAGAASANVEIIRPGVSPTLTTATLGGSAKNVIDFGDFTSNLFKDPADSNMRTNAFGRPATSSAMRINITNAAEDYGAEFYVIHADAHTAGCSSYNGLVGIQENGSNYTAPDGTSITGNNYPFLRNGRKIVNSSFSKAVSRGEIYVDGVKSSKDYAITADDDFHLYAFYPEVPERARGLAMRTTYERGGQKLGEFALFTETNTPAIRALITAHLLKKWFNQGDGITGFALKKIDLSDGGLLAFGDGSQTLTVSSIVGDGTVRAKALVVDDTLTFRVLQDATGKGTGVTSLVVEGELTLPERGRIVLDVPQGLKRISGKFPLVTATTLKGDLADLELVVQGTLPGTPRFSLENGTVYVEFPKRSTLVIFR